MNWVAALIMNTAYLYLLFFGFQEIQALERDTVPESAIPVVSWIKKGYKLERSRYLSVAMILSVVIAACINILYAIAVYSSRPDLSAMEGSKIPALYLSKVFLGTNQESVMAVAFLIATFTTFVPSFLAASRHLSALGEDGFLPRSISGVSWIFILASIGMLAIAGQDFLINVTDFMVLVSLAFIALSAIWIKKNQPSMFQRGNIIPTFVGASCFVAAVAIYFISPSVAVFGSIAIVLTYLIYDIFELGSVGIQLFLGVFDLIAFFFLVIYPHTPYTVSISYFQLLLPLLARTDLLSEALLVCSLFLFLNLIVDYVLASSAKQIRTRRVA